MLIYIRSNEELFNCLHRFNQNLCGIVQNDMWVTTEQVDDWYTIARKAGLQGPLLFRVLSYIEMCARTTDEMRQRPHHVYYNP
jgi:hypothetical protein